VCACDLALIKTIVRSSFRYAVILMYIFNKRFYIFILIICVINHRDHLISQTAYHYETSRPYTRVKSRAVHLTDALREPTTLSSPTNERKPDAPRNVNGDIPSYLGIVRVSGDRK
jgi:hypothetical protein